MSNPLSQSAVDFGVTWAQRTVTAGQPYWRLISVDGPLIRGGNANIYVDVLGEAGQRLADIPVRFFWADGQFISPTELKPGEPDQGTNMVMSASGNAYGAHIDQSGVPSDLVWGLGNVAWEVHHSWRVVFRRAVAQGTPSTDPPGLTMREALIQAQGYINYALGLLDKK